MKSLPLFSIFKKYNYLTIILSEKKDGSMKFLGDLKKDKEILKNKKKFLSHYKIDINSIVNAGLVHGNKVKVVLEKDRGLFIKETDGLITRQKNLFLCATVADCLPIFLFDKKNQAIGIVHSGWKSLEKNILYFFFEKLRNNFGSNQKDLLIGIGPGISKCHFEVKEDVFNKFIDYKSAILRKENKFYLDLKEIAKLQLLKAGVKLNNIEVNQDCTYCMQEKYFSYRRDNPQNIRAMVAVIGIK